MNGKQKHDLNSNLEHWLLNVYVFINPDPEMNFEIALIKYGSQFILEIERNLKISKSESLSLTVSLDQVFLIGLFLFPIHGVKHKSVLVSCPYVTNFNRKNKYPI